MPSGSSRPYRVLGVYHPVDKKAWKVGRDLVAFTAGFGLKPLPGVGGKNNTGAAWSRPEVHAEARLTGRRNAEGSSWHQDGDNTDGANMDHVLILWADRSPTQFLVDGAVYQPAPFEIVAFGNLTGYHRRPPDFDGFRMSFRQRVKK